MRRMSGRLLLGLGAALVACQAHAGGTSRKVIVHKKWPFDAAEAKRRQKETAAALGVPVKQSVELPGGVELIMVLIPPGEFQMGSVKGEFNERPIHAVKITKGYYLGATEVTQAQWSAIMDRNHGKFKGPERPVERVSWDDCQEFCRRLTQREQKAGKLPKGVAYRLPGDAEWEYACRAGTASPFCFGQTITTSQVNYAGPKGERRRSTTPVGTFPANAWGLYDMHGNVWEWCQDWLQPYKGGRGPDHRGRFRILRGGSWTDDASFCRSACRRGSHPNHRYPIDGFRVARPLP